MSPRALHGGPGGPETAALRGRPESAMDPYEAILEHVELELELAGNGDLEHLEQFGSRWDDLTRGLPRRPPSTAAAVLERASLVRERTRIELLRVREALLSELAATTRARRTVDGYAGALAPRPRLGRSA